MTNFFANNLKFLREKKNIDQQLLSEELGVPRPTLSCWETGIRTPKIEQIQAIAHYFNVGIDIISRDYSIDYINIDNANSISIETIKIPILGLVKAGIPVEAQQDIIGYTYIPKSITTRDKHYFALKINGDSMSPEYLEGDIVAFESCNSINEDAECVVMVNGNDATFKKVTLTDNGMWLKPYNTSYEPMYFSKEDIENKPVKIIAKVKCLIREK